MSVSLGADQRVSSSAKKPHVSLLKKNRALRPKKKKAAAAMIQHARIWKCLVRLDNIADDPPDTIEECGRTGQDAYNARKESDFQTPKTFVNRIRNQSLPRKVQQLRDPEADFYKKESHTPWTGSD